MSTVWEKLFGNAPPPANDSSGASIPSEGADTNSSNPTAASVGPKQRRVIDATPKSQVVARSFDSIGRRNEALRAHLDAVEISFRNIEAIRAQFHEALIPIDQTLMEIERAKVAQVETERKLEGLSAAHDRIKSHHAVVAVERDALVVKHDELAGRVADLERGISAAETASAEARRALTERTAKLERIERELEDNRRRLQTVNEQLPVLRAEFSGREKRLQEVEQQRANLHDQNGLLNQENQALRARVEEFVANVSKLKRQVSELEGRRDDLNRRVDELEQAVAHESAALANSKASHLDVVESQRLSQTSLREELNALNAKFTAAERLLADARATLRDREAQIRTHEQRALENSLAMKSKDAALADLEKDLAATWASHSEVDSARTTALERSTNLAKTLEDREIALQRAEQRVETLETKLAEQNRMLQSERELFEERMAKLKDQLEAESAARAFTEGALQLARQERSGRRGDGEPAPSNGSEPNDESERDQVARLRG
jgi:chromosome segregation ATPase